MIERLLLSIPLWVLAVAFVAWRHHPLPRNFALIAAGTALLFAALAVDPNAWLVFFLTGLGMLLWVRGLDAEARRTRPDPTGELNSSHGDTGS